MIRSRLVALTLSVAMVVTLLPLSHLAWATTDPRALPFAQDWSDTGLITVNDDWSGVPGVIAYRGDGLTAANDVDPQTVQADGSGTPVDVNANQTNPDTFATGGVAEFHLADPVVALQGSGTADAPHLVLTVGTSGRGSITVSYNLRDIDGSTDDAVQQVALQFRIGTTGDYTNVPAGYVADATTGPSQAILVTPVSAELPAAANDQPVVQIRIITTNASGSDEWVGVDDISVTGTSLEGDAPPAVASTSPADGATNVARDANVGITFSEPVDVTGAWFDIACAASGGHTATVSGGPRMFTLDPDTDFAFSESCAVTVFAAHVTDQDADDPPDNMAGDVSWSFSTVAPPTLIRDIQGAGHISPLNGMTVSGVFGIVTALRTNGFYMQDPEPDDDVATSEGIFVFTASRPTVTVGNAVSVSGRAIEFRPGGSGGLNNLTTTEIDRVSSITVVSCCNAPPAATIVGAGGRIPPMTVIDDDATDGSVETSGTFDATTDGIDFWESMEGMLVEVANAVAVGPRNRFGEIPVVSDGLASVRTARGGVIIQPTDFNPERVLLDDEVLFAKIPRLVMPTASVGDPMAGTLGVLDYSFGNFKLMVLAPPTVTSGGLAREVTRAPLDFEVMVGTYNVENLDPSDGPAFARHADLIVNHLRAPDILAIEEIQDNDGAVNSGTTDASVTWQMLIDAITAAGGPLYQHRQIDPVNNEDGGQPGGNIRVGFLFRTDRGVEFIERAGGDSTTAVSVVDHPSGPRLSFSPGRIAPDDPAFFETRKSLVGEFRAHGKKLFVIANHFSSKGGDQPLFGRFQPPFRETDAPRRAQAEVVAGFVEEILAADPNVNVIVAGDLNDFDFAATLEPFRDAGMRFLMDTLPLPERYSYVFEGNSQVLDQILVSANLATSFRIEYDPVHVNSEFADQASDHDPQVARFDLRGRPKPR